MHGIHPDQLVTGHAQVGEDVLDGAAINGIDDLGVKLLADLPRDGIAASFAELDGAARQSPPDDMLEGIRNLEDEDLVAACDKGEGDRSGELPAHSFGRLV